MRLHRTESEGWLSNAYLLDDEAGTGVLIDGNGVAKPLLDVITRRALLVPVFMLAPASVGRTARVRPCGPDRRARSRRRPA